MGGPVATSGRPHRLTQALRAAGPTCVEFSAHPGPLVFQEAPSSLYDEDGRRVLDW